MNARGKRWLLAPVLLLAVAALVTLVLSRLATSHRNNVFIDAVKSGDVEKVKAMLKSNPDLALCKGENGYTPLHYAAGLGHKDLVKLLLANNADVNAVGKLGDWTPLNAAVIMGRKDVVELLLADKADVNVKDDSGRTPLNWAVFRGYKDISELLRQHGGTE